MWKYGGLGEYLAYGAALALPFLGSGCETYDKTTAPISRSLHRRMVYLHMLDKFERNQSYHTFLNNPQELHRRIDDDLKSDLEWLKKLRDSLNLNDPTMSPEERKYLFESTTNQINQIQKLLSEDIE